MQFLAKSCLFIIISFVSTSAQSLSGIDEIKWTRIKQHALVLADDSMSGRATGTPGGKKAAQYIAEQLEAFDLTPAGDNGSFYQHIPMHGSLPLPSSKLAIYGKKDTTLLELDKDYLLYKYGAQTFVPRPADLVFVGYGIVAPEYDYSDYRNLDVSDKIVVYLSGEPPSEDSLFFDGEKPTIYSYQEAKERIAVARGARGSILIPAPAQLNIKPWSRWVQDFSFEDITLPYSVSGHLSLVIHPRTAERLFENARQSLAQLLLSENVTSFPLKTKLSFHGQFRERDFVATNVAALLPGTDENLAGRYLILAAHYDHLGVGPAVQGDSIYNGFGDNALGVAGLLEIARVLRRHTKRNRSVLFLFLTGEEKGLLGSQYYIQHPIVPHYKSLAAINVDGLAIFDTFNEIVGIGSEFSSLGETLELVANTMGLKTASIPPQFLVLETFARSDQIVFARAGIPSILIMDGLDYSTLSREQGLQKHQQWMEHRYHSPFDDAAQPVNWNAVEQHVKLIYSMALTLLNSKNEPEWKAAAPFLNARLQSKAEKR